MDPEKRSASAQGHSRPETPAWAGKEKEREHAEDEQHPPRSTTPFSLNLGRRSTTMSKRASRAPTFIPRDTAITRTDLIASAERIFARYLLPSSDKEIYLPPSLRIHEFPLSSHQLPSPTSPQYEIESGAMAQVPDMFHAQKEYVFRAMEQDAFPRFLRAKAFGNLTPSSALARLCVGLVALWAGLATAFALIFLDVKPKSKRFFVSSEFAVHCNPRLIRFVSALHTIYYRLPIPYLTPVRAGPDLGFPQPIRNNALPNYADPRTIRPKTPPRPRHLGYLPNCHPRCGSYSPILGCPWTPSVIQQAPLSDRLSYL